MEQPATNMTDILTNHDQVHYVLEYSKPLETYLANEIFFHFEYNIFM
jgi:hypothetical protein